MILSQSIVKSFETQGCYRKLQGELTGELTRYASLPMQYGNFFETKALGSGSGKSAAITDLPRLKNGAKSSAQLRIEAQAEKFKRMFDARSKEWVGTKIIGKQILVEKEGKEGTIDFLTTGDVLNDLKLTADIESEWGYWSNPSEQDHLQASHYCWLYNKEEFNYWVFDYSPKMNVLHVEVKVSDEAIKAGQRRFANVLETIEEFDEEWPRVPNIRDCRYCALKCDKRINKAGYNQIKIVI